MTPRLRIHPDAEADFFDAVRYYETTTLGLGEAFDDAIAEAVDDVAHGTRKRGLPSRAGTACRSYAAATSKPSPTGSSTSSTGTM
ncbi:hypothetical protein GCM10011512_09660 [Tersicoccus solisilvae]|uniref:Type II toxin-antitoxin system RelE/ParE family toxin n=1 Tax=Tersicoccus solisilvae TaxID=1882339 RepID=A0ABQ1NUC1_9MICC|nr:hypothetical protein GCM10011512_09660 [Tersicoccus solisilvae]